jgi:hypothetical protein
MGGAGPFFGGGRLQGRISPAFIALDAQLMSEEKRSDWFSHYIFFCYGDG